MSSRAASILACGSSVRATSSRASGRTAVESPAGAPMTGGGDAALSFAVTVVTAIAAPPSAVIRPEPTQIATTNLPRILRSHPSICDEACERARHGFARQDDLPAADLALLFEPRGQSDNATHVGA